LKLDNLYKSDMIENTCISILSDVAIIVIQKIKKKD